MFAHFVEQLASIIPPPNCANPYAPALPGSASRRHNLQRYLQQMASHAPHLLLVGEAPGYRGCRISGIPFVSRHILRQGMPPWDLFGQANDYQLPPDFPSIEGEASATIMWQSVAFLSSPPLLWNACPLHPHRPGQPASNRAPTCQEVQLGKPFLRQLLALFPIKTVVAVGNQAAQALTNWHIPHQKVRHPSHGGKQAFQEGLRLVG